MGSLGQESPSPHWAQGLRLTWRGCREVRSWTYGPQDLPSPGWVRGLGLCLKFHHDGFLWV